MSAPTPNENQTLSEFNFGRMSTGGTGKSTQSTQDMGTFNFGRMVMVNDWGSGTPPASSIKTFNGLAIASVKTVNGLAIASVKSIMGLANT